MFLSTREIRLRDERWTIIAAVRHRGARRRVLGVSRNGRQALSQRTAIRSSRFCVEARTRRRPTTDRESIPLSTLFLSLLLLPGEYRYDSGARSGRESFPSQVGYTSTSRDREPRRRRPSRRRFPASVVVRSGQDCDRTATATTAAVTLDRSRISQFGFCRVAQFPRRADSCWTDEYRRRTALAANITHGFRGFRGQ